MGYQDPEGEEDKQKMMEALTGQPCLSSCKSSRYSTASSLNPVNVRAPLPSLPWELDPLKLQSCDNPNKTNQTKTQTKTNTSSLLKKKKPNKQQSKEKHPSQNYSLSF